METTPQAAEAAVASLRERGFVNYFGMQRFGTTRVGTHEIGLHLLRNELDYAVAAILRPR